MGPLDAFARLGNFTIFALRILLSLPFVFLRPGLLLREWYHSLLGTLPLAIVAGVALGFVVWLHLHQVLMRFDAEQFLPQALALAVVLEFGPTGAGLILAGRSGASLSAELASMRLSEQIDALEVLGLSPTRLLVAPRVAACMLTAPVVAVFIIYLALGASFVAESFAGSMSWTQYQNECLRSLRFGDVVPALGKTVVFGYLIGVTSCSFGIRAYGGTEGVGRAATRGVVASTLLVLAANVLLVRLSQLLM